MGGDALADQRAAPRNQVHHSGGQTGLLEGLDELEHRQWCFIAGLENHRATGRDRREHLGDHLIQRVVPGGDGADHAVGFAQDQRISHFFFEFETIEDSGKAAGHRERNLGLHSLRDAHRRTHFPGDRLGDVRQTLFQGSDHRRDALAALGDTDQRVKGAPCRGDRRIDVSFGTCGNCADDLFCRGVDHLDEVPAGRRDPLAADEQCLPGVVMHWLWSAFCR